MSDCELTITKHNVVNNVAENEKPGGKTWGIIRLQKDESKLCKRLA